VGSAHLWLWSPRHALGQPAVGIPDSALPHAGRSRRIHRCRSRPLGLTGRCGILHCRHGHPRLTTHVLEPRNPPALGQSCRISHRADQLGRCRRRLRRPLSNGMAPRPYPPLFSRSLGHCRRSSTANRPRLPTRYPNQPTNSSGLAKSSREGLSANAQSRTQSLPPAAREVLRSPPDKLEPA
jgi:hypothetical protein